MSLPALSVLDQSPVRAGGTQVQAIAETIELADLADRLGYKRYWLAEHHSSTGLAGTAPEILVARIAGATRRIRVGTGGVMLNHYSPLKIAETFRTLEALYPGRIDLGLGRAPGSDAKTAIALQLSPDAPGAESFPPKLATLLAFLDGTFPDGHPFGAIRANPEGAGDPEIWLLGSSDFSAAYAAHFGLAFCFAQFITGHGGEAVVRAYRQNFKPSKRCPEPKASIAVFALCAETDAEAERLALCRKLWLLRFFTGAEGPYPSLEDAESYRYCAHEEEILRQSGRRTFVGAPKRLGAELREAASTYQADEIVVVTICPDFAQRLRSYELIAREFALASG